MHDESPNPSPLTNAVCMHCGYDISGTSLNADGLVTCPECGTELIRSTRTLLTKRDIHSELIRTFIVIFGIWTALTALLAMPFHDSIVGGIVVMSYIFIYPIALPITFIVEWTRLHRDTPPTPIPTMDHPPLDPRVLDPQRGVLHRDDRDDGEGAVSLMSHKLSQFSPID